jgi:hypothetical protein
MKNTRLISTLSIALGFALACGSSGGGDSEICVTQSSNELCDPDTFTDTGDACICTEAEAGTDTSEPAPDTDTSDTDTDTDTDDTDDTDDPVEEGWSAADSPCSGSQMDALYCTDAATCYVGCGSNAEGAGLFVTDDGGASWSLAEDVYGGFFDDFRVLDIVPADGGELIVSGTGSSAHRVVAFSPADGTLSEVYNNFSNVDYSMTVGSYARRSDGLQVAESLTGSGIVVTKDDASFQSEYASYDGWGSAYGWWHTAGSSSHVQVLDMVVVDDEILGVGAQINVPPVVYLPPRSWSFGTDSTGDGYLNQMWETVQLAEGFDEYSGECWRIDGNSDGLAVVCVNQDVGHGRVYTIGSDWRTTGYDAESWTMTRIEDHVDAALVLGNPTWNEGVCRGPDDAVIVVGRNSMTDEGYVVHSPDGGVSWTEITDDVAAAYGGEFGPVTRCMFTGTHLIIGGPGLLASVAIEGL